MEQMFIKKNCDQPGCKILEGGTCLDGFNLATEECPHFKEREITKSDIKAKPIVVNKKTAVQLFTGRELSQANNTIVTDSFDNRLIMIVGESESGKTTFLAELFINFQKGSFCKYYNVPY